MLGLERVVALGVTVLPGNVLGRRFHVAPPVMLLVVGALSALSRPSARPDSRSKWCGCSSFLCCCTRSPTTADARRLFPGTAR